MEKAKKGLILKTWERCRSMGHGGRPPPAAAAAPAALPKTRSWPRMTEKRRRVTPEGRLCVRVGPGKERFLIKMEYVNHPLFRALLDQAEAEYGYTNEGPLDLPCEVELFRRLLWEIDQDGAAARPGCNFARGYGGGHHHLLSPRRTPLVLPSPSMLSSSSL